MTVNPTTFQWRAPDTNTDGTPITVPLNYELGVDTPEGFDPLVSIAGILQTDGVYQAPISDMNFSPGDYRVALRTLATLDDGSVQNSDWTSAVDFTISLQVPNRPLEFVVF